MKIIKLQAENFKKLTAVEITPTGNIVEITGKNGQGKTSVLDAIWVALAGLEAAPRKPIRKGADEARIRLDLGEIVVTRTFKQGKDGGTTSTIRVENAEGARFPTPQTLLDQLLGRLTFDPLAFARMDARAQFDTLKGFVPGVNFDEIAEQNRKDYDLRTAANRKSRDARAAAEQIKVDPALPANAVSVDDLVRELDDAGKHNADIETRKANRQKLASEAGAFLARSIDMAAQARETKARAQAMMRDADMMLINANDLEKKSQEITARLEAAGALPEPIDTTVIRGKITNAERVNEAIKLRVRRQEWIDQAKRYDEDSAKLSEAIDMREVKKREAIAQAKLPVDGVTFGENEIVMNGVPFSQAADADQLRVSLAIAMAMNPKLKVIRVRDGSLLDDDSMRLVSEMADAHDFQVWIERVSSDGKVGIVLEDGHIKHTEA